MPVQMPPFAFIREMWNIRSFVHDSQDTFVIRMKKKNTLGVFANYVRLRIGLRLFSVLCIGLMSKKHVNIPVSSMHKSIRPKLIFFEILIGYHEFNVIS